MNLSELSVHWCNGRINSTWMRQKSYSTDFWDRHWQRESGPMKARNHWVFDNLNIEAVETAADIGCGSGDITLWLGKQGVNLTAIDKSEVAIQKLKGKTADSKLQVHSYCLDWLNIEVETLGAPWDLAFTAYTLGTVDPVPYLEKMFHSARKIVIVEPSGLRHWQHPGFWPLLEKAPFDPGPDYDVIVHILKELGADPQVLPGEYSVSRDFSDIEEAILWLLERTGVDYESGREAARVYLEENLVEIDRGIRMSQTQQIVMLTINGNI